MRSPPLLSLTAALALMLGCSVPGAAMAQAPAEQLEKVLILSRHGVRAAMSTPEQLESATARPWPHFKVPRGHLTDNGHILSRLLGRYHRELYVRQGLLNEDDCAVFYWANVTQRTIATAEAVAEGLSPGCSSQIRTVGEGGVDPLFEAVASGVAKPDPQLARAAVAGRVGGDLTAWSASHSDAAETLDGLLMQCETRPCDESVLRSQHGPKRRVASAPAAFSAKDMVPAEITGPEAFASGVTESLLMAWADGHDFESLGWKGLNEEALLRAFALHQNEFDLRLRTPYVAQATSSYLAIRLLSALQPETAAQTAFPQIHPDAATAKIVFIAGHDGTLAMLAGLLRLEWSVSGYQPNQIAPGGSLVIERWRRADGQRIIRARYTAQSLSQLRRRTALSTLAPPLSSPIFIPGCSEGNLTYDCPLDGFTSVVREAIEPSFAGLEP